MDEPTAALGEAEAARLFEAVRSLRAAGTAVVYVSHRLGEVLALADRITVLRDGRSIGCFDAGTMDEGRLVEAISSDLHREAPAPRRVRSEEHTSELQSLMRTSYAVF